MEKTKEIINEVPQGVVTKQQTLRDNWKPKTALGRKVKSGEIATLGDLLQQDQKFLEFEIIDVLVPDLQSDLINVGQSKGKFGGGKRSIWRQTQKKTSEGNKPKFGTLAVVGNKDGYVGMGSGKAKETMPAREKAVKAAKLNIISMRRGCGAWDCGCKTPHSIPFKVEGKCGAAKIILIPAARGTGLCVEKECRKVLEMAGIKDVYAKVFNTKTKMNLVYACFDALKQLSKTKIQDKHLELQGIIIGEIRNE